MTRVWRIVPRRYSGEAFSGRGGLFVDARWNHAGRLIVYTASSEALAALEVLAHVRSIENITDLVVIWADFADLYQEELTVSDLPTGWDRSEGIERTKHIGDEWLDSRRTAVLWVPSVQVKHERNVLLNPLHREFQRVKIGKASPFTFDQRIQGVVAKALSSRRSGRA